MAPKLIRIHIAMSPCYPPYGVIAEYDNGKELWDCDCASGSEEVTRAFAQEQYPSMTLTEWDDPNHYSNRGKRGLKPTKE